MKKILIVEDDDLFRKALSSILTSNNFTVIEAANGLVAKNILLSEDVELVISDIEMPESDGVELLEWIRKFYDNSREKNKSLPVILMTGFAQKEKTENAFRLRANDYIAKPFRDFDLLEKIDEVLEGAQHE